MHRNIKNNKLFFTQLLFSCISIQFKVLIKNLKILKTELYISTPLILVWFKLKLGKFRLQLIYRIYEVTLNDYTIGRFPIDSIPTYVIQLFYTPKLNKGK
jgi:hypothetical protein